MNSFLPTAGAMRVEEVEAVTIVMDRASTKEASRKPSNGN